MKEQTAQRTIRRELLYSLLFSLIAFICFSYKTNAQGWSFTPQIKYAGNCEGAGAAVAQANAMLSAIGNLAMPTKNQCEALRQQILAIQVSGGECTVGYTCTPCSGSDISYGGGVSSPGAVNFNGMYSGEPLFSSHESFTTENYGIYYKQMQEILGFSGYLGSALMPMIIPKVPQTGDKPLDETYAKLSVSFNPPEQGGEVDLRESSMVVPLTHTREDDLAFEKWMNENTEELKSFLSQKNPELTQIELDDIIECVLDIVKYGIDNQENFQISDIDWGLINDKYDKKSLIQLGVDFLVDEKGKRLDAIDKNITQGIDDVLNNKASLKTTDEIISTVDDLLKTKAGLLTVNAVKWGSNALSLYGLTEDIGNLVNDFKTDQNFYKKMYDASVTVADAGLLVGGIVAAAGVTAGALTVSTPVAVGATVTIVAAKLFVDYDSAKKK